MHSRFTVTIVKANFEENARRRGLSLPLTGVLRTYDTSCTCPLIVRYCTSSHRVPVRDLERGGSIESICGVMDP